MQQLSLYWMTLDPRRKAMLLGGVAALLVSLLVLTRLATTPSYALLYSGLEPSAAADVITALEASGASYSVRGDSIYVDQTRRDELRMSLAGEGLPANGAAGYELLDSLSGFGTTSQMFDAAYWRAKEGELARTIIASPHIRAARVHLANPGQDPFQDRAEVTASITVRPAAGGLGTGHAQALRYLVASSVPGLRPENVTVVDADSGQVLGGDQLDLPGADADSRAETLRRNIERLLAARVGSGNAVVEVSVDLTTAHETILERRIDPESRVIVETETEERSNSSQDGANGAVTVASNLAEGDAGADGQNSSSQNTETHERVTFEVSETQREIQTEPGNIRRISVAVLVNGVSRIGADGVAMVEPRPDAELQALEHLVQSAIGFDAERGDQVTVRSMVFEPLPEAALADAAGPGLLARLNLGRLLQMGLLTVVALGVILGLVRPALAAAATPIQTADLPGLAPPQPGAVPAAAGVSPGAPAVASPPPPVAANLALSAPAPTTSDAVAGSDTGTPAIAAPMASVPDPVDRLRRLIEEREDETVEILRSWMEDDEETA